MRFLCIIPARYGSSRFEGKPLADMAGKPMIQRVYEQVEQLFDTTVVATDDQRIEEAIKRFGGNVVMTSSTHRSGTDRCMEAYNKIAKPYDVIINVQGDEPFIQTEQIELLKNCFEKKETTEIATLVKPILATEKVEETLMNPNMPKVVINKAKEAIYFSRSIIPYQRNIPRQEWLKHHIYYKHIGLYAYRSSILKEITKLPQSSLEVAESLEQLRWIENGYTIQTAITNIETIGVDTKEDLEKAIEKLNKQK